MSTPAVEWLEENYERTADALAAVRARRPLTPEQAAVLREAGLPTSTLPPRPSVLSSVLGQRRRPPEPEPGGEAA